MNKRGNRLKSNNILPEYGLGSWIKDTAKKGLDLGVDAGLVMADKTLGTFGATNVIDPTAGARQALQSVGGLLDDYGKRQQSTQEMLLREQGRQDALVQQDIANKRADAQLQLSQNQDTRAAEKSAQDTEEFGIVANPTDIKNFKTIQDILDSMK